MKKMKFLVATDFSACAENASLYAAELAKVTGSELYFIHVLIPIVDDSMFHAENVTSIREDLQQRMSKFVEDTGNRYGIACKGTVEMGDVQDEILKMADLHKVDFIVMGTHGTSGLNKLFGSVTASVIEHAEYPLIAVPESASFLPPQNIVYATDYENSDIHALRQLARIAEVFGAEINVVHVVGQYEERGTELSVIDYFSGLVEKHVDYPKITCRTFKNTDVEKGIEVFSQTVGARLVALATRKRNLVGKLFGRSLAKELAYHSKIPLLAFRVNEADRVEAEL